nr:MAG: ORF1 [TTV-like mini virus]
MPFWRRPYYQRRWRYYSRRRPRRYISRTFRRRRRRRVRRRRFYKKLKKLTIKEWQPPTIRKLKITGLYQTFFTNIERIEHNNTLYIDAISPFHLPAGGGMSLSQFTMRNLFDQHLRLRNWWTKSNEYLPLVRFLGVNLYCYYLENVDYIIAYQNQFPMKANRLIYNSTQPSVMQLMKHRKIIPCRKYHNRRKPYKKIRIRPPAQLQTKWYFQSDFADIPLVNIMCTACSLDRWYTSAQAVTPTISFTCLDATIWQNHNFKDNPTSGYQKQPGQYMFGVVRNAPAHPSENGSDIEIKNCTLLANTNNYQEGRPFSDIPGTQEAKWTLFITQPTYWGNPFIDHYLFHEYPVYITQTPLSQIKQKLKELNWADTTKLNQLGTFTLLKTPNVFTVRYNPYRDKGIGNIVYVLPITNRAKTGWDPPEDPQLVAKDLPLWTLFWGLADWFKRSEIISSAETHYLFVFQTKYTDTEEKYFIPIGQYFLEGRSQYFPADSAQPQKTASDLRNWHPKMTFQLDQINRICRAGPGTVKLPDGISVEGHIKYQFYFKIGGSPPPMEIVTDPGKQPKWPIPSNFYEQTSLQSPTIPYQHFLYHFDQRGDFLTKTAAKRLKKDFQTETTFPSITESTWIDIPPQSPETSDSETSDTEKSEKTIQQQLKQQLREQQKLRLRIQSILNHLSKLE